MARDEHNESAKRMMDFIGFLLCSDGGAPTAWLRS